MQNLVIPTGIRFVLVLITSWSQGGCHRPNCSSITIPFKGRQEGQSYHVLCGFTFNLKSFPRHFKADLFYVLLAKTSFLPTHSCMGFPWGPAGKESACNEGDLGSIPGLGRPPGEGKDYPLQYFCLESSMDRGAWRATVHGLQRVRQDWSNLARRSLSCKWQCKHLLVPPTTWSDPSGNGHAVLFTQNVLLAICLYLHMVNSFSLCRSLLRWNWNRLNSDWDLNPCARTWT